VSEERDCTRSVFWSTVTGILVGGVVAGLLTFMFVTVDDPWTPIEVDGTSRVTMTGETGVVCEIPDTKLADNEMWACTEQGGRGVPVPITFTPRATPCPEKHRVQEFVNREADLRVLVFKFSDTTQMRTPVPGHSGVSLCVPTTVTAWEWRVPA
jgi:hypothetical protein